MGFKKKHNIKSQCHIVCGMGCIYGQTARSTKIKPSQARFTWILRKLHRDIFLSLCNLLQQDWTILPLPHFWFKILVYKWLMVPTKSRKGLITLLLHQLKSLSISLFTFNTEMASMLRTSAIKMSLFHLRIDSLRELTMIMLELLWFYHLPLQQMFIALK
jgi:hypothetical protein